MFCDGQAEKIANYQTASDTQLRADLRESSFQTHVLKAFAKKNGIVRLRGSKVFVLALEQLGSLTQNFAGLLIQQRGGADTIDKMTPLDQFGSDTSSPTTYIQNPLSIAGHM